MSELVFNTGKQYLTEAQIAHVNDYIANRPQKGFVWVDGDTHYFPTGHRFPKGAITHETYPNADVPVEKDDTRNYHTPFATLEEKYPILYVDVIDVKHGVIEHILMPAKEWLKLIEKAVKTPCADVKHLHDRARMNERIASARLSGDPLAVAKAGLAEQTLTVPESAHATVEEIAAMHKVGKYKTDDVTFARDIVKKHTDRVAELEKARGQA